MTTNNVTSRPVIGEWGGRGIGPNKKLFAAYAVMLPREVYAYAETDCICISVVCCDRLKINAVAVRGSDRARSIQVSTCQFPTKCPARYGIKRGLLPMGSFVCVRAAF